MRGADSAVTERLTPYHRESAAMQSTQKDIACFGDDGLRTLLYSSLDVSESTFTGWATEWDAALLNPDEKQQVAMRWVGSRIFHLFLTLAIICEADELARLSKTMEEGHQPLGSQT